MDLVSATVVCFRFTVVDTEKLSVILIFLDIRGVSKMYSWVFLFFYELKFQKLQEFSGALLLLPYFSTNTNLKTEDCLSEVKAGGAASSPKEHY